MLKNTKLQNGEDFGHVIMRPASHRICFPLTATSASSCDVLAQPHQQRGLGQLTKTGSKSSLGLMSAASLVALIVSGEALAVIRAALVLDASCYPLDRAPDRRQSSVTTFTLRIHAGAIGPYSPSVCIISEKG